MDGGRLQCGGIVVERLQELAAKAHVAAGFTGPEMRGQCAAQWPGDAEEVAHSRRAAEYLQIVARDDRAHTEADQGKGCIGADGLIDIYFQLFGQVGQAVRGIGRFEIGVVAVVALLCQELGHSPIDAGFVPNAMDHDDFHWYRLGAFAFFLLITNGVDVD